MKHHAFVLVLAAALVARPATGHAQHYPGVDPSVLRGLKSVRTFAYATSDDPRSAQARLESEARRTMEIELRRAGIPIDPASESALMVLVAVTAATTDIVSYTAHIQLWERTDRLRTPEVDEDFAVVWRSGVVPSVSASRELGDRIRHDVRSAAELFVLHYLMANPR